MVSEKTITSTTKTNIAGAMFDNCIMNAAGVWCYSKEELDAIDQSFAATFVSKSSTRLVREGNPEPRYWQQDTLSINSMGLPNLGLDYYIADIQARHSDKAYFLSYSPLNFEDLAYLVARVEAMAYKGLIEVNLSCPNVPGKPQLGYDFEASERFIAYLSEHLTNPFGLKLPPYFDLSHFDQMAEIVNRYPVRFINTMNSIGNGLVIEGNSTVIAPKNGFGGIGGSVIKPTALANVHAFYQRLRSDIDIVGTGGIVTGRDVYEHILCGAKMVQVGTTLQSEGPLVFERLTRELKEEMAANGYQTLSDFHGKLSYLN